MFIEYRNWALLLLAAICLPLAGLAQPQDQGTQAPQSGAPVTSEGPAQAPEQGQAPTAGTEGGSLLGVEEFSPGHVGGMRSYFLPSLQVSEMADSNIRISSGQQRFEGATSVVARLSMYKVGRHFQTTADYLGGGLFYSHNSQLNSTMHQFGITESYQGRRWGFLLDDRASYLPESAFGFGGFGWAGSLGGSLGGAFGSNLTGLNPTFNPVSSLLTIRGSRIFNVVSTQVSYLVGPRSSITLAGSYGVLHFRTPGFSNSRNASFQAGYSHVFTPHDQVGISYGFGLFQYPGGVASFQTHFLQLTYGRRITGRMSASFGAGTQVGVFKTVTAGSTTPVSWTAIATVNYSARRANLGFSYNRFTTNGGGILAGATSDYISLGLSKQLTRNWSGSLTPSFSRNRSLPQTSLAGAHSTYDSLYAVASLSRSLGRYTSMFLTYTYGTQRSQAVPCPAGDCKSSLLRHAVSIGFDFHPRQLVFD
jgi:hypothetical protein